MNTSNKILGAFFLVVFLVPGLMLMAFKSKMRKGQFTLVTRNGFGNNWKTGKFRQSKVVKLEGIPGSAALKVNLRYTDSIGYRYAGGDDDSISVRTLGDTVFIAYKYRGTYPGDAVVYLDLSVPEIENLVVNNADVNLLSIDTAGAGNLNLEMNGTGQLNIGSPREYDFRREGQGQSPISINRLIVKMNNTGISIGRNVSIGELIVDANGNSSLAIDREVSINEIRGSISDSSTVQASWNYLKRFTALPAN